MNILYISRGVRGDNTFYLSFPSITIIMPSYILHLQSRKNRVFPVSILMIISCMNNIDKLRFLVIIFIHECMHICMYDESYS